MGEMKHWALGNLYYLLLICCSYAFNIQKWRWAVGNVGNGCEALMQRCHHRRSGIERLGRTMAVSLSDSNDIPPQLTALNPMKIAFQGESGAYSEKAARELLGPRVVTAPYESFEDTFKAVASREVDYACVPIENSLGVVFIRILIY